MRKNRRGTVREKKERRKKENTHHALSVTSLKKLAHKKKKKQMLGEREKKELKIMRFRECLLRVITLWGSSNKKKMQSK